MTEPLRVAPEAEDAADNLSQAGAHQLAARLDAYWRSQGHTTARFWVEPARNHGSQHAIFVVRSNLVGGWPPRIQSVSSWR